MPFIDKIYVINLKKRPNKKESVSKRLLLEGLGAPIEFVEAFDLRFIDDNLLGYWLKEQGFATYKNWKTEASTPYEGYTFDDWDKRDITNAEIGCFLSHYFIWQKCASQNETFLILEDDATWNRGALKNFLDKDSKDIPSYDLLYLGRNKVSKKEEAPIDDKADFVKPQFSYNTHSYVIKPSGASKLLSYNPQKNIIPADEFLTSSWITHRRKDVAELFKPQLGTISCNLDKFQIWQQTEGAKYSSDISNPTQENELNSYMGYECLCLTVSDNSHNEGLEKHIRSASARGVKVKVLGLKSPWEGGDMVNDPGGGQKINLLIPEIDKLKNNKKSIVLFVDGFDILFFSKLDNILEKFLSSGKKIIFGAEKSCWPDRSLAEKYPDSPYDYKYLNSGNFIGYASDISNILEKAKNNKLPNSSDDQLYYTEEFLFGKYKESISLDYYCELFQCLAWAYEDISIKEGVLYNKVTKTRPLIAHGNSGINDFWELCNKANNAWRDDCPNFPVGRGPKLNKIYISLFFVPDKSKGSEDLFIKNILNFNYPKDLITLHIQSTNSTLTKIKSLIDANTYSDILFTNSKNEDTCSLRDHAVESFLSTDNDYFFYIEDLCLINNKDIITKLINTNKDLVAPALPEILKGKVSKKTNFEINSTPPKGCFVSRFVGGCYLVKRRILENNQKPYTKEGSAGYPKLDGYIAFVKNLSYNRILFHVDNSVDYGVIDWNY